MENNKLQDPCFQQVFKPLVAKVRREQKIALFIRGDEEKKTGKATRTGDSKLCPRKLYS